jgi:hypothetical protein
MPWTPFLAGFCHYPESVSVREWCRCKAATMLIIHMVYQRVANAADAPLSDAPQGGGVNRATLVKLDILQQQHGDIK